MVWGEQIFVTSVISAVDWEAPKPGLYFGGERRAPTAEHRWMVYAIDFTSGRIHCEREVHRARPATSRHLKTSYASETPVTDGKRVYAYFGNVGLFVFDMHGTLLWSKNFDTVCMRNGWGTAASPVLHRGRLYIVNDNDTQSFLAAFDAPTGREIWRVTRDEHSNWTTPFVWEHAGGAQIVTSGSAKVRGYNLEGRLKWELKGVSSIAIPTPFAAHKLLFVSSGYVGDALRPMYAIRPEATGDISLKTGESANAHIARSHPQLGSYNTTAPVYSDYLYTLLDRGFLLTHDARTGRELPTPAFNHCPRISVAPRGDLPPRIPLHAPGMDQRTGCHLRHHAQSRASSIATSANGSTRTIWSPSWVPTTTQRSPSRRNTSNVRRDGLSSHTCGTPSRA